jgi:hypothetical protein
MARSTRTVAHGAHVPEENLLLAAFTPDERERIYPHLQLVAMPLGK